MISFPFVTKKAYDSMLSLFQNALKQVNLEKRAQEKVLRMQKSFLCAVKWATEHGDAAVIRVIECSDEKTLLVTLRTYLDPYERTGVEFKIHSIDYGLITYNDSFLDASCSPTRNAEIIDIGGRINCGYGSILMREFINYCRCNYISYIYGRLSPRDIYDKEDTEHYSRMIHFYTKHGFEILDIPESQWKKIKLNLQSDFKHK